jgi:hypothetical protein
MSQRNDYYTFREREFGNSAAELMTQRQQFFLKEEEINRVKAEKAQKERILF